MTTYKYSISTDFPNQKVDTMKLQLEITQSEITIALDRITTSGDDCDIVFKADLQTGEKIALDGIIANHDGIPLPVNETIKVIPTFANYDDKTYYDKGFIMTCYGREGGEEYYESILDIEFDRDVLLWGGKYKAIGNINENDTIELLLYVTVEGNKIPVHTCSETRPLYFFPEDEVKRKETAKTVLAEYGMGLRIKIRNHGTEDYKFGFILEAW
jgi:hypothetical protein